MRTHPSSAPSRAAHPSTTATGGRHELGQNFLVDRRVVARIVASVAATQGPIIELGAGSGALTRELAGLGRPLTALEIDPRRADALRREFHRGFGRGRDRGVTVVQADALAWRYPTRPHVIVGNVPFHLTTAIMRALLARGHWTDAILLTQWEVARRRCGVGGSSLLTAQWHPWFSFSLHERVPSRAFRPVPSVDGGVFSIERRAEPLVDAADRAVYQAFVAEAYRGRGRGLAQILTRTSRPLRPDSARRLLGSLGLPDRVLPSRLGGEDWAAIWASVRERAR
ncbi:MAG TPA: 23S ribosomal RNA methyltransferase Erm [Agromyces sp.]|nr:23S ribosomal RNA methyltransferase Erm [Agromyces sp.]